MLNLVRLLDCSRLGRRALLGSDWSRRLSFSISAESDVTLSLDWACSEDKLSRRGCLRLDGRQNRARIDQSGRRVSSGRLTIGSVED